MFCFNIILIKNTIGLITISQLFCLPLQMLTMRFLSISNPEDRTRGLPLFIVLLNAWSKECYSASLVISQKCRSAIVLLLSIQECYSYVFHINWKQLYIYWVAKAINWNICKGWTCMSYTNAFRMISAEALEAMLCLPQH